ncbi:hypothetical protein TGDOM2_362020 [Toxoplasma gondii GAB2-2007-GAL-DOM2]|uniref:Uncharacterized protein n=1 Tax=Toxoplasma gondii GAB2-2007-GAL-DOM2 TaxID=1130820 RepID=A0A086K7J7_TOXGO|nr:hypothetical protein TGDOM2_362020 [Toxoplasma gondii GAB2-2007-GAL-DOM2]
METQESPGRYGEGSEQDVDKTREFEENSCAVSVVFRFPPETIRHTAKSVFFAKLFVSLKTLFAAPFPPLGQSACTVRFAACASARHTRRRLEKELRSLLL